MANSVDSKPQITNSGNLGKGIVDRKQLILFLMGLAIFPMILLFLPQGLPWATKATIAITGTGIFLWAFEPVPIAYTSLLVLVGMIILQSATFEVAISGFSSSAVFLILAGFMMAKGVNSTRLGHRMAYFTLAQCSNTPSGILWGIILAPQLLSLFIPATAVRTTLLLPMVVAIVASLKLTEEQVNIRKMMFLGLALGASISGVGFLPSALGNILTVELLESHLGVNFLYFDWFWMAWPIWVLSVPVTWWLIKKVFPPEINEFAPGNESETKQKLKELGPITLAEKKCLAILTLTVVLWMTQGWHGLSIAVPALLAVVLMCTPGTGFVKWDQLMDVKWDTYLLLAVTISLGNAVNHSGAASFLAEPILQLGWVTKMLTVPLLAVIALTIFTQIYHVAVANIATCVVTLVPIVFQVAARLDADPVVFGVTVGLASLYGYILIIEILPAIIVHGEDTFNSQDFLRVGIFLTIAVTIITTLVAATWWRWIGFI
ncbi:MAG: DASS family sodium-coupled anion symporter [Bacillota bacterium]|nr:DASS family sodium-coupled anion symporter [Bacillota bacterium]